MKQPTKIYPRALFGALVTAGVIYVLVGLASSIALPAGDREPSSGPLHAVVASGVGIPSRQFSLIALALSPTGRC